MEAGQDPKLGKIEKPLLLVVMIYIFVIIANIIYSNHFKNAKIF